MKLSLILTIACLISGAAFGNVERNANLPAQNVAEILLPTKSVNKQATSYGMRKRRSSKNIVSPVLSETDMELSLRKRKEEKWYC
jgi:hypothetical protein